MTQLTVLYDEPSGLTSYLLVDEQSREAVAIDTLERQVDLVLRILREGGSRLRWVLETHSLPAQQSGSDLLREATAALVVASDLGTACANLIVREGDELPWGQSLISIQETPCGDGDGVTYAIGGYRIGPSHEAFTSRGRIPLGSSSSRSEGPRSARKTVHTPANGSGSYGVTWSVEPV